MFFKAIRDDAVSGAYYLHGNEEYSKERAVQQCGALLTDGMRELNYQTLKSPTAAEVTDACDTLPLFDKRRIVVVTEIAADEAAKLASYCEKLPDSALLLFLCRGEAGKTGVLFKALSKLDRVVTFEKCTEERAIAFLEKRAKAVDSTIGRVAARRIVEMVGVDMATLENAINKAAAYVGYGTAVTVEAVERCITPNLEYNIFKMIDAIVSGNKRGGIGMLTAMLKNGESGQGLAAFIEGRIKLMLRAKQYLADGQSDQQAAKCLGGSPYAAGITVKNAKKCSMEQLENAVISFACVDAKLRKGTMKETDSLLIAVFQNF